MERGLENIARGVARGEEGEGREKDEDEVEGEDKDEGRLSGRFTTEVLNYKKEKGER